MAKAQNLTIGSGNNQVFTHVTLDQENCIKSAIIRNGTAQQTNIFFYNNNFYIIYIVKS